MPASSAIHVSLETTDPARFQAIRGGLFAKVAEGIARLASRRRERGLARPVIGLAVTVLADTIEDIHGIYDLYVANGLDGGISHQLLQTMPAYRDRYDAAMAARLVPPTALAARSPRSARRWPGRRRSRAEDFFYASLFAGFDPRRHDCPWLDHGAYLGHAGSVAACCFIKDAALGDALADPAAIAAGRAALSAALRRRGSARALRGCSTAAAIVRAQAGDRHSRAVVRAGDLTRIARQFGAAARPRAPAEIIVEADLAADHHQDERSGRRCRRTASRPGR